MTKPKKDVKFQKRASRLSNGSSDGFVEERSSLRNGHAAKQGLDSGMSTDAAWTDDDKEKIREKVGGYTNYTNRID